MESAHAALCPHCGAPLPAGAFFCGRCGAGQPGTAAGRYDIFPYDAAYARQQGTCVTFGQLLARGLAYVLCPLVLLFFGDGWMLAGLLLSFAGVGRSSWTPACPAGIFSRSNPPSCASAGRTRCTT